MSYMRDKNGQRLDQIPVPSTTDMTTRFGRSLRPGHNGAVVTGDSLSDYGGTNAINTGGSGAYGGPTWFNRLCMISGQRIQRMGTFALAGSTTQQWHDTQIPQVLAMSPRPAACFIQIGTNDAGVNFNPVTWGALIADGVQQLLAAGILPILCLTPPRGLPGAPTGINISKSVKQQHLWILRYTAKNGLPVLDNYSPVAQLSGGIRSGFNSDQTHMNEQGYRLQALDAYTRQEIHKLFPPARLLTTKDKGDFLDLLAGKGLMQATTDWPLTGTAATVSLVAPSVSDNLSGNWLTISRAASSTGATNLATSNIISTAVAGDIIAFSGRMRLSGYDASPEGSRLLATLQARWTVTGTGFVYAPIVTNFGTDLADGTFYMEIPVPTGATALNFYLAFSGTVGSSAPAVASLGELTVYNLTAAGAL